MNEIVIWPCRMRGVPECVLPLKGEKGSLIFARFGCTISVAWGTSAQSVAEKAGLYYQKKSQTGEVSELDCSRRIAVAGDKALGEQVTEEAGVAERQLLAVFAPYEMRCAVPACIFRMDARRGCVMSAVCQGIHVR